MEMITTETSKKTLKCANLVNDNPITFFFKYTTEVK